MRSSTLKHVQTGVTEVVENDVVQEYKDTMKNLRLVLKDKMEA